MNTNHRNFAVFLLCVLLAGCMVGPNYKRPVTPVPPAFTGASGSTAGGSGQNPIAYADWWKVFNDPLLNDLEGQTDAADRDIKIAVAHLDQAAAVTKAIRSQLFPTVGAGASGLLRAGEQEAPGRVEGVAAGAERPGLPVQRVHQDTPGAQIPDETPQPGNEGAPRVAPAGQSLPVPAQLVDFRHVHGLDQVLPGREVPVQGGHPDPGLPRDLVQRDVGPAGRERAPPGRQDGVEIARRVRPVRPPLGQQVRHRHPDHPFTQSENGVILSS